MTLFKKCQTFFHQTSMRFHTAMATLEPQKYVIARTVGTENILAGQRASCDKLKKKPGRNILCRLPTVEYAHGWYF